jgi:hypothetical protein
VRNSDVIYLLLKSNASCSGFASSTFAMR